jgi:response regulator RpfG family c-di-GMP phosphodiesterase
LEFSEKEKGKYFNPKLVDLFSKNLEKFLGIKMK